MRHECRFLRCSAVAFILHGFHLKSSESMSMMQLENEQQLTVQDLCARIAWAGEQELMTELFPKGFA